MGGTPLPMQKCETPRRSKEPLPTSRCTTSALAVRPALQWGAAGHRRCPHTAAPPPPPPTPRGWGGAAEALRPRRSHIACDAKAHGKLAVRPLLRWLRPAPVSRAKPTRRRGVCASRAMPRCRLRVLWPRCAPPCVGPGCGHGRRAPRRSCCRALRDELRAFACPRAVAPAVDVATTRGPVAAELFPPIQPAAAEAAGPGVSPPAKRGSGASAPGASSPIGEAVATGLAPASPRRPTTGCGCLVAALLGALAPTHLGFGPRGRL